jgi:type VI secretion system secreted protein Hcp
MRKALVMAFALVALIAAGLAFGRSDTVAPGTGRQVVGNAKIDGIGQAEVRGFTFGGTQSGTPSAGGGGGAGKFTLQPLTIVKPVDSLSGKLMLSAASGQRIPTVTLELPGAGGTKSVSYRLTNVVVSAVRPQATGAPGDGVVEEVSFSAAKVEVQVAAKG